MNYINCERISGLLILASRDGYTAKVLILREKKTCYSHENCGRWLSRGSEVQSFRVLSIVKCRWHFRWFCRLWRWEQLEQGLALLLVFFTQIRAEDMSMEYSQNNQDGFIFLRGIFLPYAWKSVLLNKMDQCWRVSIKEIMVQIVSIGYLRNQTSTP